MSSVCCGGELSKRGNRSSDCHASRCSCSLSPSLGSYQSKPLSSYRHLGEFSPSSRATHRASGVLERCIRAAKSFIGIIDLLSASYYGAKGGCHLFDLRVPSLVQRNSPGRTNTPLYSILSIMPESREGSDSAPESGDESQLTIRIPNPKMYIARQSQWKGRRGKPRCDHCRINNLKVSSSRCRPSSRLMRACAVRQSSSHL